jgi:hypothetical protein
LTINLNPHDGLFQDSGMGTTHYFAVVLSCQETNYQSIEYILFSKENQKHKRRQKNLSLSKNDIAAIPMV